MLMRFLRNLKRKSRRLEMRRIRKMVIILSRTAYPYSYSIEEKKTDGNKEEDIPINKGRREEITCY